MDDIKYTKVGESKCEYGITEYWDVTLRVDIQLGDTLYKNATITIPESTLESIVHKYETTHSW